MYSTEQANDGTIIYFFQKFKMRLESVQDGRYQATGQMEYSLYHLEGDSVVYAVPATDEYGGTFDIDKTIKDIEEILRQLNSKGNNQEVPHFRDDGNEPKRRILKS